MSTLYPVLGSAENCNPSWNALIHQLGQGYDGMVRLAQKVFYSLPKDDHTTEHEEDIIQDALAEVYHALQAQEQGIDNPVAWASVVMKNSMIRSIDKIERRETPVDTSEYDVIQETNDFLEVERRALVKHIRDQGDDEINNIIDKIMGQETLSSTERTRWSRFRTKMQRDLVAQGVTHA